MKIEKLLSYLKDSGKKKVLLKKRYFNVRKFESE